MKEKIRQLLEECGDNFDVMWDACKTREEQIKLWWSDEYAEHLVNKGVLIPPCKVGDKIYFPHETQKGEDGWIDEGTVTTICYDGQNFDFYAVYNSGLTFWHMINDGCGFLKKEEAEKCLRERCEE